MLKEGGPFTVDADYASNLLKNSFLHVLHSSRKSTSCYEDAAPT